MFNEVKQLPGRGFFKRLPRPFGLNLYVCAHEYPVCGNEIKIFLDYFSPLSTFSICFMGLSPYFILF